MRRVEGDVEIVDQAIEEMAVGGGKVEIVHHMPVMTHHGIIASRQMNAARVR